MSLFRGLLSYVWPVSDWKGQGRYGPLELAWEGGHLVVNSGKANQSYGNLHAVWQQCFEDEAVRKKVPRSILVLGFGAGSAASILRRESGIRSPIIGVDGDAVMLGIAKQRYHVERLGGISLVEMDAMEYVQGCRTAHDLLLVDLCHELDLAPGVDEEPFVAGLRRCATVGGKLFFNTIAHDGPSALRSQRVGELLRHHFDHVKENRYQGINRVWIAS